MSFILLKIAQTAVKQFGPRYYLTFPVPFDRQQAKTSVRSIFQPVQSFMIHKHEHQSKYRLRSQSWSSMSANSDMKPLGYSNQKPSWDKAVIQLPLESKFKWPDKQFSISLWYNLEDNAFHRYEYEGSSLRNTYRKQRSFSLFYQRSNEAWCEYGCEDLFHLCSFGGSHAIFEVWIGSRTGCLQYR